MEGARHHGAVPLHRRDSGGTSFGLGMAAGAAGMLHGWSHVVTTGLLVRLLDGRNPDGGYGLGRAYDAFADGTLNGPETTYTVTLAGHVGPTLLAAYRGGSPVMARADVQAIVDLLVHDVPRIPIARGQCVAYSLDPNDSPPAAGLGQVHNVNSGVALFLHEANAAGFGATGMQRLITDITLAEIVAYREASLWWPYLDDDPDLSGQDPDHNSYMAEAMYRLAYWIGREVAYSQMAYPPPVPGNSQDPIVHTRLVSLPGGPGSWSRTAPGVTLWAELGDTHRAEQDAYLATLTGDRAAQFAYYAARNVLATD